MAREVIINIPQDFTDIYTANVNIRKPGNGVAGVFNSSPSARNAKITTYIIRIAGGTDSLNIDFDVYIRGRWK